MQEPTWEYEEQYWGAGIGLIAGVDEVGMGALAGPVCAAAVIFDSAAVLSSKYDVASIKIRDSKLLSAQQREKAQGWIKEHALAWAIGEATVEEINHINIRQASHLAMRRALTALGLIPDLVLVDGNPVQLHEHIPTTNIIKGDQLCYSIAAASILAKVHRDALMVELDAQFPVYGFASHKGYGSPTHLAALKTDGATIHHRRAYAPVAAAIHNGI